MKTKQEKVERALTLVIKAWDSLEGGRHYSPKQIERWLVDKMSPAMSRARDVLEGLDE